MTERVPLEAKRRPRRDLGRVLTFVLHCPFCLPGGAMGLPQEVRVVAYRTKTVRMACDKCGLRFSINWIDVALKLVRDGAPGWGDQSAAMGDYQGMQAFEAGARGLGRWEAFLDHAAARTDTDGAVDSGEGTERG